MTMRVSLAPEFALDCRRDQLSSDAFRLHVEAIAYFYQTEDSSLILPRHMLAAISAAPEPHAAAAELVKRGYWAEKGEDFVLRHHARHVRSSITAQERCRRDAAKRQKKYRGRQSQKARGGDREDNA